MEASRSSRRAPVPHSALTPTQLLEKIDQLDWDETLTPPTVMADGSVKGLQPATHNSTLWLAIGAVIGLIGLVTFLYFWMKPEPPPHSASTHPIAAAAPAPEPVAPPPEVVEPAPLPAPIEVASTQDVAKVDQMVAEAEKRDAELRAQRKADRLRKQHEAEVARQAELDRQREQQEAARKAAEQQAAAEAAKAAQAKAQAPKAPSSPQEVCAGEANAFTRGLCEVRTCNRAEWRTHPQCLKRIDDQLRSISPTN